MVTAVVAIGYGGPDELRTVEEATVDPEAAEVAVDVRAIGVNALDWKVYSGAMGADPGRLPMHLGLECAGVVESIGAGVTGVAVGEEVVAYPVPWAYASRVVVPVGSILSKPPEVGWEDAAGLLLTGTTAVHLLTVTRVGEGDRVLVHGAAGGVGLTLVQLAVALGATVIGTCAPAHDEVLRGFGVLPVRYGAGLVDRVRHLAPEGVDVALDLVGTDEAVDASLALVPDRDRIATIAAFARGAAEAIHVLGGGAEAGEAVRLAARQGLLDRAAAGELTMVISSRFALTDAATAHRVGRGGHTTGKAVLLP